MKLLYSQSTQSTYPYPRNDGQPIIGLDPDFLILEKLPVSPPTYDEETEVITSNWEIDLDALEYRQEWTVTPKPTPEPIPNWDGFNATMLGDASFNLATGTVMGIAPAVALALPAALTQVSTNGIAAFALTYGAFVSIASVPLETRQSWSAIAEANHLPADFTAVILQGNDPE